MEAFKTWEEMTVLEQYACQYWDMHKDAYGVRPRCIDTSSWTEADFEAEFKLLGEVIEREEALRKESEDRVRYYAVSDDGYVKSDNKHTYGGYKPFYRTVIATYVSENEFRGI